MKSAFLQSNIAELRLLRGESISQFVTVPTAHAALLAYFTHFCYLPGHSRHLKILPLLNFKDFSGKSGNKGLVSQSAQGLTMATPLLDSNRI